MNANEFVEVVRKVVKESAVEDGVSVLTSPPAFSKELIELSDFYNAQSDSSKEMIIRIMHEVTDYTLFGMFCVLDGVRAIEDDENKGDLILIFEKEGYEPVELTEDRDLHDIYRAGIKDQV